jgi:hypothetical protein
LATLQTNQDILLFCRKLLCRKHGRKLLQVSEYEAMIVTDRAAASKKVRFRIQNIYVLLKIIFKLVFVQTPLLKDFRILSCPKTISSLKDHFKSLARLAKENP